MRRPFLDVRDIPTAPTSVTVRGSFLTPHRDYSPPSPATTPACAKYCPRRRLRFRTSFVQLGLLLREYLTHHERGGGRNYGSLLRKETFYQRSGARGQVRSSTPNQPSRSLRRGRSRLFGLLRSSACGWLRQSLHHPHPSERSVF